ncbi:MAG: radical SAM protein [Deltaproteobacteria bacterium]|nr:radical SAM protein [Deltaproteobacteria bacterium]
MKPLIIPIFIPHQGCPHRCIYCDQTAVSGTARQSWTATSLQQHVEQHLQYSRRSPVQIAFYGGSFTVLSEKKQRFYLEAVQGFIARGRVQSLRLSTRPDAVSSHNLNFLQEMNVSTIELGAQSFSDSVLARCERGHSSSQTREAANRIRGRGFYLGLQLMPGLPGDSERQFLRTVDAAISLEPDFVRLYPTVVLAGTRLAHLYRSGHYRPLTVNEAVHWCKQALLRFTRASIPVIRTGLQAVLSLEQQGRIVAGPYHPAFGQLVKSALWYDRLEQPLEEARRLGSRLVIHAAAHQVSDIRGHRNTNTNRWQAKLGLDSLRVVGSTDLQEGEWRITAEV